MEKIKVWNWQRVHNKNASVADWVYKMLMDKRITVLEDSSLKILDGSERIAKVDDYLVWFRDTNELRVIGKEEFESKYETMT